MILKGSTRVAQNFHRRGGGGGGGEGGETEDRCLIQNALHPAAAAAAKVQKGRGGARGVYRIIL